MIALARQWLGRYHPLFRRANYLRTLHPAAFNPAMSRLYLVNRRYNFIYASIPKVASASLTVWFLRTQGIEGVGPRSHSIAADRFALGRHGSIDAWRLWKSSFTFTFVRNPLGRLVSAYVWHFVTSRQNADRQKNFGPIIRPIIKEVCKAEGRSPDYSRSISFREFVDYVSQERTGRKMNIHWRPQIWFVQPQHFDYLGRLENLKRDFETIRQRIGIRETLSWRNKSSARSSSMKAGELSEIPAGELAAASIRGGDSAFYTDALRRKVAERYRDDIETFGY